MNFNQKRLIGLKVCSQIYGNGIIEDITINDPYPVCVRFNYDFIVTFLPNGYAHEASTSSSLLVGVIEDYIFPVSKPIPNISSWVQLTLEDTAKDYIGKPVCINLSTNVLYSNTLDMRILLGTTYINNKLVFIVTKCSKANKTKHSPASTDLEVYANIFIKKEELCLLSID